MVSEPSVEKGNLHFLEGVYLTTPVTQTRRPLFESVIGLRRTHTRELAVAEARTRRL